MDAGHEKAGDLEQRDDLVADEREVEVARAGTVGIERCAVLPAFASDAAAAKHQRDDLLAFLRFGQFFDWRLRIVLVFSTEAKGRCHRTVLAGSDAMRSRNSNRAVAMMVSNPHGCARTTSGPCGSRV